ncbi:keratin-like protein KRT222 [Callorhinchus milii]|uniref:Keratin 222 n=1 Tax=Callorhinchus milii TaxID=7868 RepID=V9L745_CALMI|nr:keratin-like protein KRT222 [Callorhinchus milii]|eukprot:gi/632981465/ref/XP_007907607.1/ PREDICTED: keratin-like protein KRT222 [Callorhinchus milii]
MEVSQLLTDIRTHYTSLIQCTPAALSASSKVQLPDLTGVEMSNGDDSLRAARAELNDAKRQWHSLQVEMDSLQALEKGLESSLHATQQRYKLQLHGLESVITELETELQEVRRDIEHQVQEHQILLNTKMKLEWEIATYRSLLDREERRLCGNGPESSLTGFAQREIAVSSAAVLENHLEQKIETLTTREILGGNVVRQSAEARGKIQTEKVDEVIKEWEGSFFKDNPHLRKKSVSLRFDLHLAATDEGCSQTKQDSLPNIEVRLVMRKSSSIPSLKA